MSFKDEIDKLKNWVTDNFSSKNPDSEFDVESTTSDFNKQIEDLEKKFVSDEMQNLQEQLNQSTETIADLETRNTNLESELNQLKAKPSIPASNGDPKLNINPKDKDETGKALLSELPADMRKKLRITSNV